MRAKLDEAAEHFRNDLDVPASRAAADRSARPLDGVPERGHHIVTHPPGVAREKRLSGRRFPHSAGFRWSFPTSRPHGDSPGSSRRRPSLLSTTSMETSSIPHAGFQYGIGSPYLTIAALNLFMSGSALGFAEPLRSRRPAWRSTTRPPLSADADRGGRLCSRPRFCTRNEADAAQERRDARITAGRAIGIPSHKLGGRFGVRREAPCRSRRRRGLASAPKTSGAP